MNKPRRTIPSQDVAFPMSDFVINHLGRVQVCPECDRVYRNIHPISDCEYGIAEQVMET